MPRLPKISEQLGICTLIQYSYIVLDNVCLVRSPTEWKQNPPWMRICPGEEASEASAVSLVENTKSVKGDVSISCVIPGRPWFPPEHMLWKPSKCSTRANPGQSVYWLRGMKASVCCLFDTSPLFPSPQGVERQWSSGTSLGFPPEFCWVALLSSSQKLSVATDWKCNWPRLIQLAGLSLANPSLSPPIVLHFRAP